ncbi:MAG: hypothetical protein DRJ35_04015 [Thermoprotei archaeon]|nr:MAG: hypothetical protein DRJ35_04015 [Thermoprotei archaeon]
MKFNIYRIIVSIVVGFLVIILISEIYATFGPMEKARETARNIIGEKSLELKEEAFEDSRENFVLLNVSTLILRNVPKGYKPLFGVKSREGKIFVVLSDANYSRHLIMVIEDKRYVVHNLDFKKVSDEVKQGKRYVQEVKVKGEVKKIEGFSQCRIVMEEAVYGVLSMNRLYFDCSYTTQFVGLRLVTTHARGYIYYIPGDKVTTIIDLSYDQLHSSVITRCRFRHTASGTGTPAATVRAEGKYLICYDITSTQWVQRSQFVFDIYGLRDCDGSHSAWAAIGCGC